MCHSLALFGLANDGSVYVICGESLRPPAAGSPHPCVCGALRNIHQMPNGQKQRPGHVPLLGWGSGQHFDICGQEKKLRAN